MNKKMLIILIIIAIAVIAFIIVYQKISQKPEITKKSKNRIRTHLPLEIYEDR